LVLLFHLADPGELAACNNILLDEDDDDDEDEGSVGVA
jgi:hypothetical protein